MEEMIIGMHEESMMTVTEAEEEVEVEEGTRETGDTTREIMAEEENHLLVGTRLDAHNTRMKTGIRSIISINGDARDLALHHDGGR